MYFKYYGREKDAMELGAVEFLEELVAEADGSDGWRLERTFSWQIQEV